MSVYSGFATRALETNYNAAVYKLIFILQTKLHRQYTNRNFFLIF